MTKDSLKLENILLILIGDMKEIIYIEDKKREETKEIIRALRDNRDNLSEKELEELEEMEEKEFIIPLDYEGEHIGWTNVNSVAKHGGIRIDFINKEVKDRITKICYPTSESICFASLNSGRE